MPLRIGSLAIGLRRGSRGHHWTTTLTEDGEVVGEASASSAGPFRVGRRWGAATNADLLNAMQWVMPMSDEDLAAWQADRGMTDA